MPNRTKSDVIEQQKTLATDWFRQLRDAICDRFVAIEMQKASEVSFNRKSWSREGGGGGEMSSMRGEVFEKVGVNISTVWGEIPEALIGQMPAASKDGGGGGGGQFWAAGISLVAHMQSPKVPAVHFNTRMIIMNDKLWFGGGADLTPTFEFERDTNVFHNAFAQVCDKYDPDYYPKFKKNCDEYFMIKHRNEPRGVGGIFFDYLNTGNWPTDFAFIKDVGQAFLEVFEAIVRSNYDLEYDELDKKKQLYKRGRYVEFNLLYDRGTKFGFLTNGNPEAILMSMPPICAWE